MMFVDDLALVTEKDKDMKRNVEVFNEVMTKWKMKINKVLVVQRGGGTCHIVIDGVEVEGVQTANIWGPCLMRKDHAIMRLRTE